MAAEDLDDLRKREGKLFGSESQGRSSIMLRLNQHKFDTIKVHLLPHKQVAKRPAIKPGQEFEIEVTAYSSQIEEYVAIMQLTLLLGGIGRRSRRGFGAIEILKVDGKEIRSPDLNHILDLLETIHDNRYQIRGGVVRPIQFSGAKYPWIREIEIGTLKYETHHQLLETIGRKSSRFRDDSLGFVDFRTKERLASPVWISAIDSPSSDGLLAIATTLHFAYPERRRISFSKQKRFRKSILNGK